jgi:hypothetical protein
MLTVGAVRDAVRVCYPYDPFNRQVCCRCRETIQKTVKNGRHWLLGYSSRLSEIHDEG